MNHALLYQLILIIIIALCFIIGMIALCCIIINHKTDWIIDRLFKDYKRQLKTGKIITRNLQRIIDLDDRITKLEKEDKKK